MVVPKNTHTNLRFFVYFFPLFFVFVFFVFCSCGLCAASVFCFFFHLFFVRLKCSGVDRFVFSVVLSDVLPYVHYCVQRVFSVFFSFFRFFYFFASSFFCLFFSLGSIFSFKVACRP